jgi:3-oxoacyl-[acyl-carrier-protein (ACP)] synthase III-like protein
MTRRRASLTNIWNFEREFSSFKRQGSGKWESAADRTAVPFYSGDRAIRFPIGSSPPAARAHRSGWSDAGLGVQAPRVTRLRLRPSDASFSIAFSILAEPAQSVGARPAGHGGAVATRVVVAGLCIAITSRQTIFSAISLPRKVTVRSSERAIARVGVECVWRCRRMSSQADLHVQRQPHAQRNHTRSGGLPFVAVVQTADFGSHHDAASRLDGAFHRSVLAERGKWAPTAAAPHFPRPNRRLGVPPRGRADGDHGRPWIVPFCRFTGAKLIRDMCVEAGCAPGELSRVVIHQANKRIIDALVEQTGIVPDRCVLRIDAVGNLCAASTLHALATDLQERGRPCAGERVLVAAFGAGATWAGMVVEC